jgi:hypothetical protein
LANCFLKTDPFSSCTANHIPSICTSDPGQKYVADVLLFFLTVFQNWNKLTRTFSLNLICRLDIIQNVSGSVNDTGVTWYFESLKNQPRVKYTIWYFYPGSNFRHGILNPIIVNWTLSFLPKEQVHNAIRMRFNIPWVGSLIHHMKGVQYTMGRGCGIQ